MVTPDRLILHSSTPSQASLVAASGTTTGSSSQQQQCIHAASSAQHQPSQVLHTANALWKRVEQLRRWKDSETNRESSEPRHKSTAKVNFQQPCIFLAACASGEKSEILALLGKGVDINTANADGMTALHQACIDGNIDIVKFLDLNGADLNYQDNEGWAPLHAAASCGHLDITCYLVNAGADLTSCTSDRELAIDLADNDEVANYLNKEISKRNIDLDSCRDAEHGLLLAHCKKAIERNDGSIMNPVDHKTNATVLHIAAAKGYDDVLEILLDAGCNPNFKDADGWTPLHAAAHWDNIEAAKALMRAGADCDELCNSGYQVWDVCDEAMFSTLINYKAELKNRNAATSVQMKNDSRNDSEINVESDNAKDSSLSPVDSESEAVNSDVKTTDDRYNRRYIRDVTTPARELITEDKNSTNNERIGKLQASLRSLSEKFKYSFPDANSSGFKNVPDKLNEGRFSDSPIAMSYMNDKQETSVIPNSDDNSADMLPQRDFVASRRNRFEAVAKERAAVHASTIPTSKPPVTNVRSDDDKYNQYISQSPLPSVSPPSFDQIKCQSSWGSCVGNMRFDQLSSDKNTTTLASTVKNCSDAEKSSNPRFNNRLNNRFNNETKENSQATNKIPTTDSNKKPPIQKACEWAVTTNEDSKRDLAENNKRKKSSMFAANVSVSSTSSSSTPECAVLRTTPISSVSRNSYRTPTKDEQSEAERKKRSARARRERRSTQGVSPSDVVQAFAECNKRSEQTATGRQRTPNRWTESESSLLSTETQNSQPVKNTSDHDVNAKTKPVLNSKDEEIPLNNIDEFQLSQKRKPRSIQRRSTGRISTNQHFPDDQDSEKFNKPKYAPEQIDDYRLSNFNLQSVHHDNSTQTSAALAESFSYQQYQMKFHEKCIENEKLMSEIDYLKRELHDKDQIINKMKSAARADQLDKRKFDALKSDNVRLKDENAALIRKMSALHSVHQIRSYIYNATRYPSLINITYGRKRVTNGLLLSKEETQIAPRIELCIHPSRLYTLIMIDPDAPSPENPKLGPWLHLYRYNISIANPGGIDAFSYSGPAPPQGTHHYVFILFRQRNGPVYPSVSSPTNFPLIQYIQRYQLEPRSILFYRVKA
ncbi:hypothetical protein GJ496_007015 [Pomphorhynchus laevis]|nr:hypothetical protein GJ496_007015 [Pomphorhynchus laevis]